MTPRLRPAGDWGAASVILATGGLGASVATAFCCALPPLLASAGVAGGWTLELQSFLGPKEQVLVWLAISGLGSGTMLWLWQMRSVCTTGFPCRSAGLHLLTPLGLVVGGLLTWFALTAV